MINLVFYTRKSIMTKYQEIESRLKKEQLEVIRQAADQSKLNIENSIQLIIKEQESIKKQTSILHSAEQIRRLSAREDELSNYQRKIRHLHKALAYAYEQTSEWTDGFKATLAVIKNCSSFIETPGDTHKFVEQCSQAMNLITNEINAYPNTIGEKLRDVVLPALIGLGQALVGLVLTCLSIVVLPFTAFAALTDSSHETSGFETFYYSFNFFRDCCQSFGKAIRGKESIASLSDLNEQLESTKTAASFFQHVKTHHQSEEQPATEPVVNHRRTE